MKVKIKWPNNDYDGQIGEVVDELAVTYHVKMKDGRIINPYKHDHYHAQCEIVEDTTLVVGNKYVPLKKSTGGDLSGSAAWNLAKEKNQPYLYLTRIDKDHLVLDNNNSSTGDFFLEDDVIPYEEEFVLPKEWCIKVTKKNEKVIREWYNASYDIVGKWFKGQLNEFYSWSSSNDWSQKGSLNDWSQKGSLPELTLEQFKKHILKQTDMKKIIGYKFKEGCEKFEKAAVAICKPADIEDFDLFEEQGYKVSMIADCLAKTKLEEAEVLGLWFEPVYEEPFKVGDWVRWTGCNPLTAQIIRRESGNFWVLNEDTHDSCSELFLRKATPEEIKAVTTVKISGYELEKNSDGSVTFGCQTFSKETVTALKDLFSRDAFKFSCKIDDTDITLDMINKML